MSHTKIPQIEEQKSQYYIPDEKTHTTLKGQRKTQEDSQAGITLKLPDGITSMGLSEKLKASVTTLDFLVNALSINGKLNTSGSTLTASFAAKEGSYELMDHSGGFRMLSSGQMRT